MAEENQEITDFDAAYDAAFEEANADSVEDVVNDPEEQVELAEPEETIEPQNEDPTPDTDAGTDYQHKYSSAMGRLKASQQQNKELSDELAKLKEQFAAFQNTSNQQSQEKIEEIEVDGLDDIPEDLQSYFKEDSTDGKRLRRMVEEYGADYAIPIAETVRERRELQTFRKQAEEDRANRVEEDHYTKIANAVPEFADALTGSNRQTKFNELVQGVEAWIGTLSYSEGTAMERVVREGTPDEVISMLKSYSRFRNGSRDSAVRNLARSNMAVPTQRNAAPPKNNNTLDDFDSAFDEAVRGR